MNCDPKLPEVCLNKFELMLIPLRDDLVAIDKVVREVVDDL